MILRPSGSYRWGPGACPGSARMEAQYPETEPGAAAREGTAAHWYVTERLDGRIWPVGTLAPNGYPLDQDMLEGGDQLVEAVAAARAQADPQARLYIEHRVTMHESVHPWNEGTLDVALVDVANHRVHIWDYKYGHRYVEVFKSWQLVDYMAGVLEGLSLDRKEALGWSLNFHIVQPRWFGKGGQVRSWRILGHQFWPIMEELSAAAHLAASNDPPLQTGAHCRDCTARHACPALQAAGGLAIDMSDEALPYDMPLRDLALEARQISLAIDRLEARKSGLDEVLIAAMNRGEQVPYWGFSQEAGREKWSLPADQIATIGDMFGVNLRKTDVVTPNQARKAGLDEAVTKKYASRTAGAKKLVLLDSMRAEKAFSI